MHPTYVSSDFYDDTLVNIYVASGSDPLLVQRSRLRTLSDEVDDAIIDSTGPNRDHQPTLRFPNDTWPAWEYILRWIMHGDVDGDVPSGFVTVEPNYLAEAWYIGKKWKVPKLQDAIMLKLLHHFNKLGSKIDVATITAAFGGPIAEWNELKELAVEEAVKCIYHYEVDFDDFDLDECDKIRGLMPAIVNTHRRLKENPDSILARFKKPEGRDSARWEEFLVDGGLGTTFQFNKDGKYQPKKRKWSMVEPQAEDDG